MLWNTTLRNNLPPHDSEVLIKVNGAEYISVFCAEKNHFRVNIEDQTQVFSTDHHEIHWSLMQVNPVSNKKTVSTTSIPGPGRATNEVMRTSFTIIIADDDPDDQEMMKRGLKECKIKVDIVPLYDGVRVMDYLLRRQEYKHIKSLPDLILLDLNMPLMDGFEVLKEIRKHPHLQKIPLYVVTTSRNTDDGHKALDLGANGFYTKGARSKDIVQIMKAVCEECF